MQNPLLSAQPIKKKPLLFILLFALNLPLYAYKHPGGMHPEAQINFVRKQVRQKAEPYYSAYRQLLNFADSALFEEHHALTDFSIPGYYHQPEEHVRNSKSLSKDAFNAYSCALAWQISGKKKYARRALYFINAWSSVNKGYSESDGPLVMSYVGTAMVYAAELMYHCPQWGESSKQQFAGWLKTVYQKACNEIREKKNNWADWGRFGSSLSAYFLDDTLEMNENARLLKSDLFEKIAEDGHMPAETRRGANGIWYTYFSLSPMTATAWIVYNATGENIFTLENDGRSIKTAVDYLLYYNQHPDEWKWFEHPVHGSPDSKFSDLDLKTYYSFWPADLIEAMSGIYKDESYFSYIAPHRPLCYEDHHFAWVYTTLMPACLEGYKFEKNKKK